MTEATKSKRQTYEDLTFAEKKEICQYKRGHESQTYDELAHLFSSKWQKKIGKSTICDILKQSEKWLAITTASNDSMRERLPKFDKLEQCLWLWFTQASARGAIISEDILIEKAKYFSGELEIKQTEFGYSRGWLTNFSLHKISGESEGADKQAVFQGRIELQKLLAHFDLDDIFNLDETGLFYRYLKIALIF